MIYDAIVLGVGGMGSAALYHLARRGLRALGIERFDVPHAFGSSHGESRIIRLAYAEHPDYVPLLRRAYALWHALEAEAGETLLFVTGGIDAGAEASAVVQGSLAACAVHHLPHERLDAAALARRFPGYRLAPHMVGIFQPDAGFLLPERCVVAHVAAAKRHGAALRTHERVLAWRAESGERVVVETDVGVYRARRLVIAAGAWTGSLVRPLQRLALPERQVMLWTQPLEPARFECASFPVFNLEAPEGRFYGFPTHGGAGFKIGKYNHRRERVADVDRMDRACRAEDEAVLREGIRRYFPDADGPTLQMKPCLFTNTPDEHFVIDRLPDHSNVAIAAGFSGHGFKFCSVVGEIMADLVVDGRTDHDIDLFRLARFA